MSAAVLNLAFLITGLARGGAETQLVRLARSLRARGHEVRVISMMEPRAFIAALDDAGIPVVSLGMRRGFPDPRALSRTVEVLRAWNPQVLASFMVHAILLGRLAAKLAGVPVVVSSIRNEYNGGRLRDRMLRITDSMADVTSANSRAVADQLVARGVVARRKIRVIPNGIDIQKHSLDRNARVRVRRELAIGNGEFLWLAVGRLEAQKDYPTLLTAFREVSRRANAGRLCIAGRGPLLSVLHKQVEDLVKAERVRFLGLRDDVPELLSGADGFVLSSAWEGLPNAVMEALAVGRPVVATGVGGTVELVQEGVSGYLVPPRDARALAESMVRLMNLTDESRAAMGAAGREHMNRTFNRDRVTDQWESLFRTMVLRKCLLG